jgi:hypothetical protein
MMTTLLTKMWNDEAGFIISAELVLVATVAVLAMVVGLSEVSIGINEELEDVASAFGAVNQSFTFNGICGHKGAIAGSRYKDARDFCDSDCDIVCDTPIRGEHGRPNH